MEETMEWGGHVCRLHYLMMGCFKRC